MDLQYSPVGGILLLIYSRTIDLELLLTEAAQARLFVVVSSRDYMFKCGEPGLFIIYTHKSIINGELRYKTNRLYATSGRA